MEYNIQLEDLIDSWWLEQLKELMVNITITQEQLIIESLTSSK